MKAINREFTTIINGTTQFVIPVFQRDYGWRDDQCEHLWNDVMRVGITPQGKHFIGSVVYAPSGDTSAGFTRWLLIDGQQRVTTLTLLILALRDHFIATKWQPKDETGPTAKRLDGNFLRNLNEENARTYKLVLRRNDQAVLRALLDGEAPPTSVASRVQENYDFFRDKLADADIDVLYAGIGRLVIVDVTLDPPHDDPQLVFESLNATGLDLSQADLIRNYILMRLPEREQTQLYEKYWSNIEALFRGAPNTFDSFARDYMALFTRANKQVRGDRVYAEFRVFFPERTRELGGLEAALDDMLRFARYYAGFALNRDVADVDIATRLRRLARLAEASAILVMRLSDCHQRLHTLSDREFAEAVDLLESYVFRRSVCGMQTRAYWQTFASVTYRVDGTAPLASLRVALGRLRDAYRFPSDEEFERALQDRDLYGTRHCHYMLDRFENHGSKEPTDTSGYTVEHILPQNEKLSEEWRRMLGDTWQAVRRAWLHRLGNLTLTGYNSEYSDRSFDEKKTIKGGFNESSVRLNKYVREQSVWTEVQMQERGAALAKRAQAIWIALNVDDAAIKKAQQGDLRVRAGARTVAAVPMSASARSLLDLLRPQILGLGPNVLEVSESRSVSYHAADFFVEVLPRKHRIVLLLDLDFNECKDVDDQTSDATEYKFLFHATHEGGVMYHLNDASHIGGAMRMIRLAYELSC